MGDQENKEGGREIGFRKGVELTWVVSICGCAVPPHALTISVGMECGVDHSEKRNGATIRSDNTVCIRCRDPNEFTMSREVRIQKERGQRRNAEE